MRMKSDVVVLIRAFLTLIKTQFSASIKVIRSNNGLEFFNSQCSSLFTSLGIIHQSSCVYTPQQNGVAERKHMHLLEMARALRFQAHAPLKFWGDCILTAGFLINRLPSSVLSGKSPYERFHGVPPSFDHLKVFGCLCYATKVNFSDNFFSKVIPAVFMGYSDTKKGYKLYSISTSTFFISRDVSFNESIFPFKFPKSIFLEPQIPSWGTPLSQNLTPPSEDTFPIHPVSHSSSPTSSDSPSSECAARGFPSSLVVFFLLPLLFLLYLMLLLGGHLGNPNLLYGLLIMFIAPLYYILSLIPYPIHPSLLLIKPICQPFLLSLNLLLLIKPFKMNIGFKL